MDTKLRLAAVQAAPVFLDMDKTVSRTCDLIAEAGRNGADIVGFPEGFIPGHPYWFHFVPAAGRQAREYANRLWHNSLDVRGDEIQALRGAAADAGAYVVVGCCLRSDSLGTLYNALLMITAEGELAAIHHKLVPTHAERVVHAHGQRAHAIVTMDTKWQRSIGGLICGEHFNPLARFALMAQGEFFHVGSWPANFSAGKHQHMRDAKNFMARAHALEGGVFVVNAAGVLDEALIDELCGGDAEARQAIGSRGGGSAIVDPSGEFLAGPADDEETILYADADIEKALAVRMTHDIVGHYQRPDVLGLRLSLDDPELISVHSHLTEPGSAVS